MNVVGMHCCTGIRLRTKSSKVRPYREFSASPPADAFQATATEPAFPDDNWLLKQTTKDCPGRGAQRPAPNE